MNNHYTERQDILNNEKYYTKESVSDFLDIISNYKEMSVENKTCDLSAAFDIETSNFVVDKNKHAVMYCWSFCFEGHAYFGRTWEEFIELINKIHDVLGLAKDKKLVIFVHNLSFEFGFLKKRFEWKNVFALDQLHRPFSYNEEYQCRNILYCETKNNIVFRCSYLLSNKSLECVGKDLVTYSINKKSGDLDYSKNRHTKTKMTETEIQYCVCDTKVVCAYIWEELEHYKHIDLIPLTNTGKVRQECRNRCLNDIDYVKMIRSSKLTVDCYESCRRAFQGGFVHANADCVGKTLHNVASSDFTSSYPAVILSERFPVGSPRKIDTREISSDDFRHYVRNYWCVFDIHFYGLRRKADVPDDIISISRCFNSEKCVLNNGRIHIAKTISLTITGTDFETYEKYYDWESFQISNLYVWKLDLLPKSIIECVLDFYEAKTKLKGVEGREGEYQLLKGMLNSIYGMMVTDIIRNPNVFKEFSWIYTPVNKEKEMIKYNTSKKRFTLYPWGIAVAAYARRNLLEGILAIGKDYVYSDTDSIKYLNYRKHKNYFEKYNADVISRIKMNLKINGIDEKRMSPVTIDGVEKPLGVWDFEGVSSRFKTLGCKRYLEEKKGKLKMTVAGVNKKTGVDFLSKFEQPFEAFTDNLVFPKEYSGKKSHYYIDESYSGVLTDYEGVKYTYEEKSGVYIESSEYRLGIGEDFKTFLTHYIGRCLNV